MNGKKAKRIRRTLRESGVPIQSPGVQRVVKRANPNEYAVFSVASEGRRFYQQMKRAVK